MNRLELVKSDWVEFWLAAVTGSTCQPGLPSVRHPSHLLALVSCVRGRSSPFFFFYNLALLKKKYIRPTERRKLIFGLRGLAPELVAPR
jgi:hypothetical protein